MDRVINLQMSLFGSYINIKPETEIIINLLSALKEENFVPASADVASVDLSTGKMNVESRMQMISPDKAWTIVFLPERIDFNYIYQEGLKKYKSIEELIVYATMLVQKVFGVFATTTGNRLALNCKFVLEDMTPDDMKQFCERFTNPLNAYNQDSFIEWGVRFNSRGMIKVEDGMEEECNRIVDMKQVERYIEDRKTSSIVLLVDINTMVTDMTLRFKYDNLICFVNDASEFVKEVVTEIERG